jgi:hypothetical protein
VASAAPWRAGRAWDPFATLGPAPATTFTTPAGKISARWRASASVVSGVCSEGLSTTVLPAARAGASFQAAIIRG